MVITGDQFCVVPPFVPAGRWWHRRSGMGARGDPRSAESLQWRYGSAHALLRHAGVNRGMIQRGVNTLMSRERQTMMPLLRRTLRVGRIASTDLHLHWSLLLLVAYVYSQLGSSGVSALIDTTLVVASLLLAVLIHEVGHALVAQRLGYQTRIIVLWALGGLVMFDRVPGRARHQIAISAAGPLANLALALVIIGLLWGAEALLGHWWWYDLRGWFFDRDLPGIRLDRVAQQAIVLNLVLAVFNLIPIFPLDGGQILRALLSTQLATRRADQVTLLVGAPIALLLLVGFAVRGDLLAVFTTLLIVLAASTLNPWIAERLNTAAAWGFSRGELYARQQDYARTLAYADRAITRGRAVARHHLLRSYVLIVTGELTAGRQAATAAIPGSAGAQRAIAFTNRAVAAWLQADLAAAQADFAAALLAQPDHHPTLGARAMVAADTGDDVQALADFDAALTAAPTNVDLRQYRAALRYRMGDLAGALADALVVFDGERVTFDMPLVEQQRTLRGQLPWAQQLVAWAEIYGWPAAPVQRLLGDTLLVAGQPLAAVAAYTQALASTPADAALLLARARAHQASGDSTAARTDAACVLAARPTPYVRAQALAIQEHGGT